MRTDYRNALLTAAVVASMAGSAAQAGLIHRYSFSSGPNDSVGTAHGTLVNSPAVANGKLSLMSLDLNGINKASSDTNGQYMQLPGTVLKGATNATIEFWMTAADSVVVASSGNWSRIFDFGNSISGAGHNYIMFTPHSGDSNPNTILAFNIDGPGEVRATVPGTTDAGVTHHVACVFDTSGGYMEVYIDGVQSARTACSYALSSIGTNNMWIGRSLWSSDEYLYGAIDEFRIYDRALSGVEAMANFKSGPDQSTINIGQLGTASAIHITDPGAMMERGATNTLVTVDFATDMSLCAFNLSGLTLTSSDTNIVTVNSAGKINALKPGTATLTASYSGKTTSVTITVNQDQTAATLTVANNQGYNRLVDITFSEGLDAVAAQATGNYQIDAGAITVKSATLLPSGNVVRLITDPFDINTAHTVTVSGVKDLAFSPNSTSGTISFGTVPGTVVRKQWNTATANMAAVTSDPRYPNQPDSVSTLSLLEGPTNLADNYFDVIQGYLVPTDTGDYYFGLATDDDGALYISTDDTIAHLRTTATVTVTGYTGVRNYRSNNGAVSTTAVTLQGGSKYFFRMLHREGTGGDNEAVAWATSTNAIQNGTAPIPGDNLLPYFDPNVVLTITNQPVGQNLIENRPVTLKVGATGVPSYTGVQWYCNGQPIAGATAVTYTITNIATTQAGTYYAMVTNLVDAVRSSDAVLTVTKDSTPPALVSANSRLGSAVMITFNEQVDPTTATNKSNYTIAGETISAATLDVTGKIVTLTISPKITGNFGVVVKNVKDLAGNSIGTGTGINGVLVGVTPGMVAYWPLDIIQGNKTPDVVNGYDMVMDNLTASDLVAGKWGNCFKFDNARKTILRRVHGTNDMLPVYKSPSFTISLWVNGAPNQSDRRIFAESSSKANAPMLNLGTPSNASGGSLDILSRNDGNTASMDHQRSIGTVYDNTWHHIVWIQNTNVSVAVYIDGVKDTQTWGVGAYPMTVDTTAIGGIQRAAAAAWFTGMIDDVALWNRALDPEEVTELYTKGTPVPPPQVQPLAVNFFNADLVAVAQGDSTTLHWDVSKDADMIEIQPGVGDVTSKTVAGSGSQVVSLSKSTTYTITIHRGVETLSRDLTISAIGDVAAGWALLDNFDRYAAGSLPSPWQSALGATVVDVDGNRMLALNVSGCACALPLNALTVKEGQQATLFTRLYLPTAIGATGIDEIMGLTDKELRFWSDYVNDFGPGIEIQNTSGDAQVGTQNGSGSALQFGSVTLTPGTIYNVWIDIQNDPIANGDLYSVYIGQEGDANRTALFEGLHSNRNPNDTTILGPTGPDLSKLMVGGNTTTSTVYFDDFYLSKSGYNTTVPHVAGFTTPIPNTPAQLPQLTAVQVQDKIVISWSKDLGTGYTLQSCSVLGGTWNTVPGQAVDSGTNSTMTITPGKGYEFYRLVK